jgi:hypothetical protein
MEPWPMIPIKNLMDRVEMPRGRTSSQEQVGNLRKYQYQKQ